jgi:hypothetical protein
MKSLFQAHLELRLKQTREIMHRLSIDTLFIESGFPEYYFLDDQPTYFKTNPHFNFYCPDSGRDIS